MDFEPVNLLRLLHIPFPLLLKVASQTNAILLLYFLISGVLLILPGILQSLPRCRKDRVHFTF